jgi:hypothetical protein
MCAAYFLFPRYQRDAAKFLDAKDQEKMERHIADDLERYPLHSGKQRNAESAVGASGTWQKRWCAGDLLIRRAGRGILHRRICQERKGESQ